MKNQMKSVTTMDSKKVKPERPFYIPPQKVPTPSEIINDARKSIKKFCACVDVYIIDVIYIAWIKSLCFFFTNQVI
jgi:hypothetical protein